MPTAVVTASHSPLMGVHQPDQEVVDAVEAAFDDARRFIADFAPDTVVIFAPDHYNGVFYDLMPSFCVGTAARSIGDYGTTAGPLAVDRELAEELARHVLSRDIDIALSERLHVDHGFAQPLELLFGGIDAVPVVPVFINCVAVPLCPARRIRMLGHAVGELLAGSDRRVLLVGSGGLSHDPPVPSLAGATPEVAERLIAGRDPSPEQRTERERRVVEAGIALAERRGDRLDLNPEWDQSFLTLLQQGRLDEVDGWSNEALAAEAGNSVHEVRTWIAAYAALASASTGRYRVRSTFYRPIQEWIAGFGITTATPAT